METSQPANVRRGISCVDGGKVVLDGTKMD